MLNVDMNTEQKGKYGMLVQSLNHDDRFSELASIKCGEIFTEIKEYDSIKGHRHTVLYGKNNDILDVFYNSEVLA